MQISSSRISYQPAKTSTRPAAQSRPEHTGEKVTFSSDSIGTRIGQGIFAGAAGCLPAIGAASNFAVGFGAAWEGNSAVGLYAGLGAAGLNALGTLTLAGGAIFGNSTALKTGIGMLGASGLAGGITASLVKL